MIILQKKIDTTYSIIDLSADEFVVLSRALDLLYHVSVDPEHCSFTDTVADINIKTRQSFKVAYQNQIKVD